MAKKKKKVGIFSLTCDEGCSIYLIEIFNKKLVGWLDKIELVYFLSIKDHTDIKDMDIALVEGSVTAQKDKEAIERIRKNSKILIGMGNCTITGMPSCQRNLFTTEQLDDLAEHMKKYDYLPKCMAVKEVVKLDDEVAGCPMNDKKFIETFEKYI